MYCKYCGQLLEDNALFCHSCGKQVSDTAAENVILDTEPVAFGGKFADKNFFMATLFFTISIAAAFLSSIMMGEINVPILQIFAVVSFWRLHNLSKQGETLVSFASPLKTIRVVVKVERIVLWVITGVFSVVGILMVMAGATANQEFINSLVEITDSLTTELGGLEQLAGITAEFIIANIGLFLIVFGGIFFFAAIVCLVFNLTMYKSFYKCAASYEEVAKSGVYAIEKQSSVRKWLIFSCVCSCISLLGVLDTSNFTALLTLLATVAEICYLVFFIKLLKEEK